MHGARLRLVGHGDRRVPFRRRRRELDGVLLNGGCGIAPARGIEVDEDDDQGVDEEGEAAGSQQEMSGGSGGGEAYLNMMRT